MIVPISTVYGQQYLFLFRLEQWKVYPILRCSQTFGDGTIVNLRQPDVVTSEKVRYPIYNTLNLVGHISWSTKHFTLKKQQLKVFYKIYQSLKYEHG